MGCHDKREFTVTYRPYATVFKFPNIDVAEAVYKGRPQKGTP